MKAINLKFSAVLIGLLIGTCSCENVLTEGDPVENQVQATGGEDTDGPMVVGLVIDLDEEPVHPSELVLYKEGYSTPLDSVKPDVAGAYRFNIESPDDYYIEVYVSNLLEETTELFEVQDSSYVVITVEL